MPTTVPSSLPRLLRRVWAASDPDTATDRMCDAQQALTHHQRVQTVAGPYWICAACGQLHHELEPPNLPEYYDSLWQRKIETFSPTSRDMEECKRWLELIEPFRECGRLLEVGSGLGVFLKSAADHGWQPEGVEMSSRAASFASEYSGAEVAAAAIEDVSLDAGAYDVILCDNVFEHLREPHRVLENLSRGLRNGGVIFLQTLSAQSLSLWFAPTTWVYYGEGHLCIPSHKSLAHYFRHTNLRVIRRETHGFRKLPWDHSPDRFGRRKDRFDKLLANIAARIGRGHRIKLLLEKRARDPGRS